MDGILVIDKPTGPTSHDVVSAVRKILKEKKVGHTGTLDPMATGVLPLVLGNATKLARYLSGGDKTYRATITLGIRTNTLDAVGDVIETKPVNVDPSTIPGVLAQFVGNIEQLPPMYSAKKMEGKRLYELARQGIEIERETKHVKIYTITMLRCELPEIEFDVSCSVGTYVRTLAEDIGLALGCGAHLSKLSRLKAGPFSLEQAISLEQLKEHPEMAKEHLQPLESAISALPRLQIPGYMARALATGYQLSVGDLKNLDAPLFATDDAIAISIENGALIAVARAQIESGDLDQHRRQHRALTTERVINRQAATSA